MKSREIKLDLKMHPIMKEKIRQEANKLNVSMSKFVLDCIRNYFKTPKP